MSNMIKGIIVSDIFLIGGVDEFADRGLQSNVELCCELIIVILHVSTFFI